MSLLSKLLGMDSRRRASQQVLGQMQQAGQDELSGTGWQDAFKQTAGAELAGALPGLRTQLQTTREDAIRRGVSGGDLGTSAEGDIMSAFQRNTANAFAGQAASMYNQSRNRYLGLLGGQLQYDASQENANRNFWSGLIGGGISLGSSLLGNRAGNRQYGGGGGTPSMTLAGYG
jgi:hypothetical protein